MPSPNEERPPIQKKELKDVDKRRKDPLDKENQIRTREKQNERVRKQGL
jgi:hypothetical protein